MHEAEKINTAEKDLQEAELFQQEQHWPQANDLLAQAKILLANNGSSELKSRLGHLNQIRRDHELLDKLDTIRLDRANVVTGPFNMQQADRSYAAVFSEAGIGTIGEDANEVALRISASSVRSALLAALMTGQYALEF